MMCLTTGVYSEKSLRVKDKEPVCVRERHDEEALGHFLTLEERKPRGTVTQRGSDCHDAACQQIGLAQHLEN